jgi:hypothetical protein
VETNKDGSGDDGDMGEGEGSDEGDVSTHLLSKYKELKRRFSKLATKFSGLKSSLVEKDRQLDTLQQELSYLRDKESDNTAGATPTTPLDSVVQMVSRPSVTGGPPVLWDCHCKNPKTHSRSSLLQRGFLNL